MWEGLERGWQDRQVQKENEGPLAQRLLRSSGWRQQSTKPVGLCGWHAHAAHRGGRNEKEGKKGKEEEKGKREEGERRGGEPREPGLSRDLR